MFVVAGRDAEPLLEVTEAALDDVALSVVRDVIADGSATAGTTPLPAALLVSGLGG